MKKLLCIQVLFLVLSLHKNYSLEAKLKKISVFLLMVVLSFLCQTGCKKEKQESVSFDSDKDRYVKREVPPYKLNITDPQTAQEHFNVGVYHQNQGEIDKALEEFKKTVELNPEYYPAHYRLGNIYWDKEKIDEAIQEWEMTVKLQPKFFRPYLMLGQAYEKIGEDGTAIENYKRALENPVTKLETLYRLGMILKDLDSEKATKYLEEFVKVTEQCPDCEEQKYLEVAKETLESLQIQKK